MMRRRAEFLLALVLTLVGGMTYLLFRPRTLLLFMVLDAVGLGDVVDGWRAAVPAVTEPELLIYSLPDGLWVASYVLIIDALFLSLPAVTRLRWAAVIPVLGIVSELLQLVGIVPGTFDWADLFCYGLPYLVYVCFIVKSEEI